MANEVRLIDYQKAREIIVDELRGKVTTVTAVMLLSNLKYATVDAVEVVHGRKAESATSETGLMCTACYSDVDRDAVFCKYCGAKMDGGNDDGNL